MIKTFKGARLYSLRKKPAQDEFTGQAAVAWTYSLNCVHDAPEWVLKEMRYTHLSQPWLKMASRKRVDGRPSEKPLMTVGLAWRPDQRPDKAHMIEAAQEFLDHMGWQDHQVLIMAPEGTERARMHLVINKVHPETGRTLVEARCGNLSLHWDLTFQHDQGQLRCLKRPDKEQDRQKGKDRGSFLSFRVSEDDYARLLADAEKAGCTLSELVRTRVLAGLELSAPAQPAGGAAPLSPETLAAWQSADHVRRIGVECNRIAHHLKVLEQPELPELTALLPEIRRYLQRVMEEAGL